MTLEGRRLRRLLRRTAGGAAIALIAGSCSKAPSSGPAPIAYDRDRCEHCQMLISDPRYAAEVRLPGDPRVHKFDDLGGALAWLEANSAAPGAAAPEIWVRDVDSDRWLDATHAWYTTGAPSPMRYGFAAHADPVDGGLPFAHVRRQLRHLEAERRHDH
ncbi:MAG: nitrous oxide reductase accessory protein NosL [Myxococcota bacterium]